jgi:predicted lipoprotein with Yx(FWY)xxD motif
VALYGCHARERKDYCRHVAGPDVTLGLRATENSLRPLIAVLIALFTAPVFAQTADAPIATRTDAEEGEYLAAGNGFALYLFKADTQGRGDTTLPRSACETPACANTWPPLLLDGTPVGADGIDPSLLGLMARDDGTTQVTYNGWPLYFYYEDAAPGEIKGHDIRSFGEDWYLIGPNGERAERDD